MDEVAKAAHPEVAADRSGLGLARHRPADELAHDGDGIRPLEGHRGNRTGRDELDEARVERLAGVDGVVLLGHLVRDAEQPQPDDLEALPLEAADDLADQAALDRVGLGEDEGALHHGTRDSWFGWGSAGL